MDPPAIDPLQSTPLTDAEITELDERLLALPEERDAPDAAMLDGFLVAVLLQPDLVMPSAWLPYVFDAQGGAVDLPLEPADAQRLIGLVMRRYNELAACITAREPFDPIVFELAREDGAPVGDKEAIGALAPWSAGFMTALVEFPALLEAVDADDEAARSMLGILRHLPLESDDDSEAAQRLESERSRLEEDVPLADLDDALAELVACVMDVADFSRPRRPFVRDAPKAGRNDPCPCGSGRKFKHCHGRSVH
jgi:uncharacterized protein